MLIGISCSGRVKNNIKKFEIEQKHRGWEMHAVVYFHQIPNIFNFQMNYPHRHVPFVLYPFQ